MLDLLKTLVATVPLKQLSIAIKKNKELYDWIMTSTTDCSIDISLSERVYRIIYPDNVTPCKHNNKKRFISFTKGYGFCGPAGVCLCAKQSVAEKVSNAKQQYSNETKKQIAEKRKITNLDRYGIENSGQTTLAKARHAEFYSNSNNVKNTLNKMQTTMTTKYGAANPMQVPEIKHKAVSTTVKKYGVENINKLPESKKRLSETSKNAWKRRKSTNYDYYKLLTKYKDICNVEMLTNVKDYEGSATRKKYQFKCLSCNFEFETYIACGHLPICKICNPSILKFKSNEENQLADYIRSLGVQIEQRNRTLINPFELDIVCHDKKIAIEYCGIYWHSEISGKKDSNYHKNKMMQCNQKGYRLITIFSDEWLLKPDIVKKKIANIFSISEQKIAARKTTIVSVSAKDATAFYESNHIQGHAPASIYLGLEYNNQLVACISFGKARSFTNSQQRDSEFELIRYASICNVQGGAGKLLKAFERLYMPKAVFSYADARWSTGNLYRNLGFLDEAKLSNPGYWYTKNYIDRTHRFNYTKASLIKKGYDPTMTEWEIMQLNGFDRIWDCGQYKFTKTY